MAQELEEIEIYIDGKRQNGVVLKGESKSILTGGGQYKTFGLFKAFIGKSTQTLSIGGRERNGSSFNGSIAEVRLWKVARTQDQIKANMTRRLQGNEEELVGYWRLDDGGENIEARNLVSKDQSGKINGATWFPKLPDLCQTTGTDTNQELPSSQ